MDRKPGKVRVDRDGIRTIDKEADRKQPPRAALVAAGLTLVILAAAASRFLPGDAAIPAPRELTTSPGEESRTTVSPTRSASRRDGVRVARSTTAERTAAPALTAAEANAAPTEEEARKVAELAQEMVQAAVAAGATEGLAAFPPPGTNPIKVGLVVPKNFDLPEGYVRHHQITDDGRRLEPILMFSPDREFVDASGQPLAIPEDGIVPEELAPAGLPLRRLAVPKNPYGPTAGLR